MSKNVIFKSEAVKQVSQGIDLVCNAIKSTIGSCGRNAFIDDAMQPYITNDGVSIARSIKSEDKFEQMGIWLVNNTCSKTFDDVGDATTTTATLLQAIKDEVSHRPENPIKIRRALIDIQPKIEKWIKDSARGTKTNQDIENVATIASESEEVGKLIAEVIKTAGPATPIYIEENPYSHETTYEIIDELEMNVGYVTSNEAEITIENAPVFATDKRIESLMGIKDVLTVFDEQQITSPVILCPDMDEKVYNFIMKLNEKGAFNYVVVRAKGHELTDMASYCGATLISTSTGLDFKDMKAEYLGMASKIIVTDKKTRIRASENMARTNAINKLQKLSTSTKNVYEKQYLTRRAEALQGGSAIIKVGAPTDTERSDLKLKILNAVNTTKSAIEEGIVEGGGMCLYRVSNKIKGNSIAEEVLRKALKAPLKNIIENAGEDYADVIKRLTKKKGYNATLNKPVDMFKSGIVDSAKATRCAFVNALSSAREFITVGVAITSLNNKNETNKQ